MVKVSDIGSLRALSELYSSPLMRALIDSELELSDDNFETPLLDAIHIMRPVLALVDSVCIQGAVCALANNATVQIEMDGTVWAEW